MLFNHIQVVIHRGHDIQSSHAIPGHGPQLEVETEAVEEGPDQHHLAGSQPQDGDAEGAQRRHQLLHHIVMLPTQVIVHVPARKSDIRTSKSVKMKMTFFKLISLAEPLVDPSVKVSVREEKADLVLQI